ncbi:lipocalin-like domain-containing protein [Geoalkalibacter subterraneus]|uniref:Hydrolase n=1 Tax=Geoalkalibacter subterraneus TaxID=483547 RepID=A0A0B5FJ78_9BACT|nr:lipocalin-like domain-containing protein [Geoalkalibacter subterraneus]AJF07418.1 hydrolase [Geoalkalibacter subterraneus]
MSGKFSALFILMVLFPLCTAAGCRFSEKKESASSRLEVGRTLGAEEDTGYARALEPRGFAFPRDHGPHPDFKTEWWYYTGNLEDEEGRRFGYQLTFFRVALAPQPIRRSSNWGARQAYMAHFALTDVAGDRFFYDERFSRGAMGLAGAESVPFHVWLEDWQARGPAETFPTELSASTDTAAIDLSLRQGKPVVLQGEKGLSQKSAEAGNASYYYSLTRMPTQGRIRIEGKQYEVRGSSWLDREWSTSALAADQQGWDWFALQSDDGHELMYYQLRRQDGSADPASRGVLVTPDGSTLPLLGEQLQLVATSRWRSPRGGSYPSAWRMKVPDQDLELQITPLLSDQELDVTIRYWEGAVRFSGHYGERPLTGYGYVELTGYAKDNR